MSVVAQVRGCRSACRVPRGACHVVKSVLEPELQGAGVHYSVVARNREPGHCGYRTGDNITRLTIQHRSSQFAAHLHSPIPRALDSGHAPAPRSAFAGSGRDGATPTPSFELVEVSRIRAFLRRPRAARGCLAYVGSPRVAASRGRRTGRADVGLLGAPGGARTRARAPRGLGDGPRNYLRYYRCILNESRPSY